MRGSFNCLPDETNHTIFEAEDLRYDQKKCGVLETRDFAGIAFRNGSAYNRPGRWIVGLKRCSDREDEKCTFGVTGNLLLVRRSGAQPAAAVSRLTTPSKQK